MGTDPLYGIAAERIATLTGAHISTARRWKRSGKHPRWLEPFLAMAVSGQLGPIERAWRGWVLRDQYLVSPEGWRFSFGEIRAIPFMHAQIANYQRLQRCAVQADWIERRYVDPTGASVG
jgi:Phage protein